MFSPKRILVAVDFSDCSRVAVERAAELAERVSAEVEVAHVWTSGAFGLTGSPSLDEQEDSALRALVEEDARRKMDALLERAQFPSVLKRTLHVRSGNPVERILELVREREPDLVVVGKHGRSGVARWVLGSVSERIVRLSPCPVLTAPPPGDERSLSEARSVVVPVDFSENSEAAVAYGAGLAASLRCRLDLLHVAEETPYTPLDVALFGRVQNRYMEYATEQLTKVAEKARGSGPGTLEVRDRIESGAPYETILHAAEDADLVVMGTQGRTGLPRVLMGSVAERVVRHASCPVVTVPARTILYGVDSAPGGGPR